ncbi:MAG TPA: GNAT family N-acetyltransferase [Steroidobacteraceae bacterium]|nr:GNAT family N-acetyltransferase [Steroidobacteraceae bacterium]
MQAAQCTIRRIRADELDELIPLCVEHAAFERAKPIDTQGLAARLRSALFDVPIRCRVWVARIDDELVGYASVAPEFSTWSGSLFWHVDCLYVIAAARGSGIGRRLMDEVREEASRTGVSELQWQTPEWNVDAQRFYSRLGASMQLKARFTLSTSVPGRC